MKIKPKHLVFRDEYLKNNNNATQAYLKANPKVSYETARVEGSRLLSNPAICALIEQQSQCEGVVAVATRDILIKESHEIKQLAMSNEKYDTALKAVELKGKLNRVFTDDGDDSEKYRTVISSLMVGTININSGNTTTYAGSGTSPDGSVVDVELADEAEIEDDA